MLSLKSASSDRWLTQVDQNLSEVLIDHAHCEKKAASCAMNLIFAYVEHRELCEDMTEIVNTELRHFHRVLDLLDRRNIRFRRLKPSPYGPELTTHIRKPDPERAIDRLLVAGLIEARSCERFGLLADHFDGADPELSEFYRSLYESETGHNKTYLKLAFAFGPEQMVRERLDQLSEIENTIISQSSELARLHS